MSKKTDQYKNLPNPALSYISHAQDTNGLETTRERENDLSLTDTHQLDVPAVINAELSTTYREEEPASDSMRLRRKVEFKKNKPTRTQRAQLVFFPEDFKLAKRAAKLEGVSFNEWATATLAAAARDTMDDYGQDA